jgi:hypothetical protein
MWVKEVMEMMMRRTMSLGRRLGGGISGALTLLNYLGSNLVTTIPQLGESKVISGVFGVFFIMCEVFGVF